MNENDARRIIKRAEAIIAASDDRHVAELAMLVKELAQAKIAPQRRRD